jgi:hypothetical protein
LSALQSRCALEYETSGIHIINAVSLLIEILVLENPVPGFHIIVCVDALVSSPLHKLKMVCQFQSNNK